MMPNGRAGPADRLSRRLPCWRGWSVALVVVWALLLPACGEGSESGTRGGERPPTAEQTAEEETTSTGGVPDLTTLEVEPEEESGMLPARGLEQAEARPLPEDPPEGIRVFPATTNRLVEGEVDYPQSPATNGDHDPLWTNCGFYDEPVEEEQAVHSLDHGVVWITYRPDLEGSQVAELRESYGREPYVIVSPYPEQDSSVVATSWRIQLALDSAEDPRLAQFVRDFRISEIAPLSGNGCVRGSGEPVVVGPESYYEEG